eukprot:1186105-Prorocentrum_minimum.AAC.3
MPIDHTHPKMVERVDRIREARTRSAPLQVMPPGLQCTVIRLRFTGPPVPITARMHSTPRVSLPLF